MIQNAQKHVGDSNNIGNPTIRSAPQMKETWRQKGSKKNISFSVTNRKHSGLGPPTAVRRKGEATILLIVFQWFVIFHLCPWMLQDFETSVILR